MKVIEDEKMNKDTVLIIFNRLRTACENSENENIRAHSYIDDLVFLGIALQNITESQQSVCEVIDRLETYNTKTALDRLIAASDHIRTEIIEIFNELFHDIAEFTTYDEEITDEELISTISTLDKLRNKHLPTLPCEF